MRNAVMGGFLGVVLGAVFLAACGGGSSAPLALTQADLDAQVALLQQQIDDLKTRLDAHEPDPAAHHPSTPKLGLNYCIALQGTFPSRNLVGGDAGTALTDTPQIGAIGLFAGNFAPRGWALCNGQELQIIDNQPLFSIIGTMYGGDGRVTFALPDLRGRVAMHVNGSSFRLGERSD